MYTDWILENTGDDAKDLCFVDRNQVPTTDPVSSSDASTVGQTVRRWEEFSQKDVVLTKLKTKHELGVDSFNLLLKIDKTRIKILNNKNSMTASEKK